MQPSFRINSNGNDITQVVGDRLLSVKVTDQAGQKSDTCEITIDDRGQQLALPEIGTQLEVFLGYESLTKMGTYVVDEVTMSHPPATVKVRAKAMSLAPEYKSPKTRSWDNQTIGQIVNTIAGEHGLNPRISTVYADVLIEHIDQTEESDAHFLTRLAGMYGAVAKPIEGNLVFVPEGQGRAASGQTLGSITIDVADCKSYSATLKDRGNYTNVAAKYIDKATGRENTVVVPVEGARTFGQSGDTFRDRKLYPSEAEARAAAAARGVQLQKGEIRVKINMTGNPTIFAEHPVRLNGFNTGVNEQDLVVHSVTHDFSARGFTTSIDAANMGTQAGAS